MRTRCRANIPASPTPPPCSNHTGSGGNATLLRGGTDYALLNSVIVGTASCLDIDETGGTTTRAADAAAAGCRAARLPLGPARLPDRFPQRRQRHHRDRRGDLRLGHQQQQLGARVDADRRLHQWRQRDGRDRPTDPTPFNADTFATVNAAAPNRLSRGHLYRRGAERADTWYAGWSCNSAYVSFGTTGAAAGCTAVPTSDRRRRLAYGPTGEV